MPAYIERGKSKGFHVWIFFECGGVLAFKARPVVLDILHRIQSPSTEIFPKQDRLSSPTQYGNFINTPLFGPLVKQERCVFLDDQLKPCEDQWALLKGIHQVGETALDRILKAISPTAPVAVDLPRFQSEMKAGRFALPPCAQRMLNEGVTVNLRIPADIARGGHLRLQWKDLFAKSWAGGNTFTAFAST